MTVLQTKVLKEGEMRTSTIFCGIIFYGGGYKYKKILS